MNPCNAYNQRINAAINAGFEIYTDTSNEDGVPGTILTNTDRNSPYCGECIDLFEDGSHFGYSQLKGTKALYQVI